MRIHVRRRVPPDPARSTPAGFWRFAAEYLLAARVAHAKLDDGASLLYPTLHLYGLAVELSLKAFLLKRGETLAAVRDLSHRLRAAMALAKRRKLSAAVKLSRADVHAIKALSIVYSTTELRYIVTGSRRVPDVAKVAHAAERLVLGTETYCTGYSGQLARFQGRRRHKNGASVGVGQSVHAARLSGWIDRLPKIGLAALGGGGAPMFILDFVMIGAVKRTLSLASGLQAMVEARNMGCARALVRMQLDTVSRLMAYTYVSDAEEAARAVIGGTPLKNLKSRDGKPLSDRYLVDRLSEEHSWVRNVYGFTSGYVHFSERQFFDSVSAMGGEGRMTLQVSHLDEFPESSWSEVVDCFNHLTELLVSLIEAYGRHKAGLPRK